MDLLKELLKDKYNRAYFAQQLYKGMEPIAASAKFNNKLFGRQGRKFNDAELKQIKEIILK